MARTSIHCGSAYDMVLNQNIDILSAITHGGWDFQGENIIILYLNILKHCLHVGREFQESCDVMVIIHAPNISVFVDDNNCQIVTKFSSVILNTQVKALRYDGHLCTFRRFTMALNVRSYKDCVNLRERGR